MCDNAETLAGAGTGVRRCSDALGPRENLHGRASHGRVCLIGTHLKGIYFMDMHLMGMHLKGVQNQEPVLMNSVKQVT